MLQTYPPTLYNGRLIHGSVVKSKNAATAKTILCQTPAVMTLSLAPIGAVSRSLVGRLTYAMGTGPQKTSPYSRTWIPSALAAAA